MVNNHHIEEYGPLSWKYVIDGTEIWELSSAVLVGISVCSNNSEVRIYIFCYVKRYHTIINQSDID